MAASLPRRFWQTLGAVKTGVILLILTVILSAAGTVILQRPATDPDEIQRAYSPQMLRLLDTLGLTNVFHAWWFVLLLSLVSLSIVAASIQRFPNSWRFFSRPYKSPDEAFRKALPQHELICVTDEEAAVSAAERALQKNGFRPERIVRENNFSLFGERNRISEMSVYIVHASLLLIFLGGIIDGLYGWRAFVSLTKGEQSSQVKPQNGPARTLPFAVRCDGAGQENYADGTPKKWWSDLSVIKDGGIVLRKQIVVNDPLVYGGVRFYQASYGQTGKLDKLLLTATPVNGGPAKDIALGGKENVALDADTTVRLEEFIPDYVVSDGQVYARSEQLVNPAAHLVIESKKTGQAIQYWMPPIEGKEQNASSPYAFQGKDVQMAYFTGLEVSHEPGQWGVWGGVVLMGIGLTVVFYFVHMRIWVVPVRDAQGQLQLWIGGTANKNRDAFEQRFRDLVKEVKSELQKSYVAGVETPDVTLAGK
ncbi:MAG TPA: cytochrome c biogenesis protein ResB [Candidatus Binatia bacterium]|nr:cytochrome c biogenesis protein ResB [Candidatus Binatia bacterium]